MPAVFRNLSAIALVLSWLTSAALADATNIVVNGNFAGGTQPPGPGTDTVANSWLLYAADASNFHIQNINGTFYAQFQATPTAADLAGGYMNGIGIPNGDPDMDCLYQPLNVIAGKQYSITFTVSVTGAVGHNTLFVGTQINMMDPLYGSCNAANGEYTSATGTGTVTETFIETAPVGAGAPAGSPEVVNLMFHGSDVDGGSILLSNVSVTEVPVPPGRMGFDLRDQSGQRYG